MREHLFCWNGFLASRYGSLGLHLLLTGIGYCSSKLDEDGCLLSGFYRNQVMWVGSPLPEIQMLYPKPK